MGRNIDKYKNPTVMKSIYSIDKKKAVLLILSIFMFIWILTEVLSCEDQRLDKIVNSRIPICQDDALEIRLLSYSSYNGLNDINSKYNLQVYSLTAIEFDDSKHMLDMIWSKGDSLIKLPNKDIFTLKKQSGKVIEYKADFYSDCLQ